MTLTIEPDLEEQIDAETAAADISAGARALKELFYHMHDDWNRWSIVVKGWRALRDLAYAEAQTNDMASQAYRDAIGRMLKLKKYAIYDQIDKQTRSNMYKLCDRVEDIDIWYASLKPEEKLRWKHPQSIVKHCPNELLSTPRKGPSAKKKKAAGKKKKGNPEADRLRALLIEIITEFVMPANPERAKELLTMLYQEDPNDSLHGAFGDDEDENDEEAAE
jgi:hypothetical protein